MKHDDFKVGTYVVIDTDLALLYGQICNICGDDRGVDFEYKTIGYEISGRGEKRFWLKTETTGDTSVGWFSNSLIISEEAMALKILEAVS